MRTAEITLNGVKYPMCFSMRVVRACNDRYGGIENIESALKDGGVAKTMDEAIWLLHTMIDGGVRYERAAGNDAPDAPSLDDMYDICGLEDFSSLREKISATIVGGSTPSVTVESGSKNAEATQDR